MLKMPVYIVFGPEIVQAQSMVAIGHFLKPVG